LNGCDSSGLNSNSEDYIKKNNSNSNSNSQGSPKGGVDDVNPPGMFENWAPPRFFSKFLP
jgi:hypothetical protein